MPGPKDDVHELLDLIAEDRAECAPLNPQNHHKDSLAVSTAPANAPLPVVLLLHRGWPQAAGAFWAHLRAIESDYKDLGDAFWSGEKDRAKAAARALADRLFAVGAGEEALAALMLAADPQEPATFQSFMPQLAFAAEHLWERPTAEATRDSLRRRLQVWWRAARGDFRDEPNSIFWLAHLEAHLELAESDKPIGEPTPKDQEAHPPGVVVMPKDKATKLNSWQATEFKDLIGARLPLVCARDLARVRATLLAEYPHAVTAIDLVLRDLREGQPVRLNPVLLVGPPGNGKSRLVRRLGDLLSIGVYRFDGAASSDSVGFGGTAKGWGNTVPSVPARAVQQYRIANAIVMVDEIEKTSIDVRSGRLWEVILGFLERETAARYRDVSLDAELDLSWISHIATANSIENMPAPLRDRYRIVRVPAPRPADLPALAAGVLREVAAENGEEGFVWPLANDELEVIGCAWERAGFSIRKLQKIVGATIEARNATAMRH
jgi:ATP-dependent Lon protease